jgi:hypothetical protein
VTVRIYVEGGPKGAHADGLRRFKNGFKQHLARLGPQLCTLDISPCGSTEETIRDFARALRTCLETATVRTDLKWRRGGWHSGSGSRAIAENRQSGAR